MAKEVIALSVDNISAECRPQHNPSGFATKGQRLKKRKNCCYTVVYPLQKHYSFDKQSTESCFSPITYPSLTLPIFSSSPYHSHDSTRQHSSPLLFRIDCAYTVHIKNELIIGNRHHHCVHRSLLSYSQSSLPLPPFSFSLSFSSLSPHSGWQ